MESDANRHSQREHGPQHSSHGQAESNIKDGFLEKKRTKIMTRVGFEPTPISRPGSSEERVQVDLNLAP